MFGKAPDTIREACWAHKLPYRLESTWGPGGRRFRRMVFSMREISALLDHYAPPVNQVLDASTARLPAPRASNAKAPDDRR
jgi:hypothetical protein